MAECDCKLIFKGVTRVGVGRPTAGGEVYIYIGDKSQWQPETLV